jgi:hypothetical protein
MFSADVCLVPRSESVHCANLKLLSSKTFLCGVVASRSEEKKEKGGANEWWGTPISSFGGSFVVKFFFWSE